MIKVILPASEIPLNSIITKRTGQKQYTIKDEILVYDNKGIHKKIKCENGSRFIFSKDGTINVIDSTMELCWLAENYELVKYLDEHE